MMFGPNKEWLEQNTPKQTGKSGKGGGYRPPVHQSFLGSDNRGGQSGGGGQAPKSSQYLGQSGNTRGPVQIGPIKPAPNPNGSGLPWYMTTHGDPGVHDGMVRQSGPTHGGMSPDNAASLNDFFRDQFTQSYYHNNPPRNEYQQPQSNVYQNALAQMLGGYR